MLEHLLTLLFSTVFSVNQPGDQPLAHDDFAVGQIQESDEFSHLSGSYISPEDERDNQASYMALKEANVANSEISPSSYNPEETKVQNHEAVKDVKEEIEQIKEELQTSIEKNITQVPSDQLLEKAHLGESVITPVPSAPRLIEITPSFTSETDLSADREAVKNFENVGREAARDTQERIRQIIDAISKLKEVD